MGGGGGPRARRADRASCDRGLARGPGLPVFYRQHLRGAGRPRRGVHLAGARVRGSGSHDGEPPGASASRPPAGRPPLRRPAASHGTIVNAPAGPPGDPMDRRRFLATLSRASLATTALAALPPWALDTLARPNMASAAEPSPFIIRNDRPECLETRVEELGRSWITRNDRFFVRSHLSTPRIDPREWRLGVSGKVGSPL